MSPSAPTAGRSPTIKPNRASRRPTSTSSTHPTLSSPTQHIRHTQTKTHCKATIAASLAIPSSPKVCLPDEVEINVVVVGSTKNESENYDEPAGREAKRGEIYYELVAMRAIILSRSE